MLGDEVLNANEKCKFFILFFAVACRHAGKQRERITAKEEINAKAKRVLRKRKRCKNNRRYSGERSEVEKTNN